MKENEKRSIRYTNFDYNEILREIKLNLSETNTFKDADFEGSNIKVLMDILAILTSQSSYYIHAAANEVFLPTAKLYKNINKIAQTLRYDARGKTSASVDVVGSLNPEYVFGKEKQFLEIPSYSSFTSNLPAPDGSEFVFTNQKPIIYVVRGIGISELKVNDIEYAGYSLPFTASNEFFKNSDGNITIESNKIKIPLSVKRPLTIIKRSDNNLYRPYDTENFPLFDPNNSTSVGQPFTNTLTTISSTNDILPNITYSLLINYDQSTTLPYLSVEQSDMVQIERQDDIIANIVLEPTTSQQEFYTIRVVEMGSFKRFYTGVLGLNNLNSVSLEYDTLPGRKNSIKRLKMLINKDGNSPTFGILMNGNLYNFNQGVIYSQEIEPDFWDSNIDTLNVNLVLPNIESPETNYGAYIQITSKEPLTNQVNIAKIYTNYIDPETGIRTFQAKSGERFGDLKLIEAAPIKTSEEKAGRIFYPRGTTVERIVFETPFELNNDNQIDYHISLTPEGNVRSWYSNKTENGFDLYIEPNTQFEGYINWKATRLISQNTKNIEVVFDAPIPPTVTVDGEISNYMIQLTPDNNVQVWYDNITSNGFSIRSEFEFEGKVSWSIINYFSNQDVPVEPHSLYRQQGTVQINPDNPTLDINFEVPVNDLLYAIQLIPNKNINVWYTNKSSSGFTINVEPGVSLESIGLIDIDWYVDSSTGYTFQQHGEIDFSGRTGNTLSIPGLRFTNMRETFSIDNLIQGSVTFSFVNINTVVDSKMNGLKLTLDPTRQFQTDAKFLVNNDLVSTNSIRVFVRNEKGVWDEWQRAGTGFDVDTAPNSQIYFVRVNPDKKITLEFGDGKVWGSSILNKEVFIFGLESIGKNGNIAKNTLNNEVIISKYILGNDNVNLQFQQNLIDLIGLKSKVHFEGNSPSSSLIDSENTKLKKNDLLIIQNKNGFGGNEVEEVDEIRQNAVNSFIRQDRNVSLVDYERFIRETFRDYLIESRVITYKDLKDEGLISENELSKYWFNHIFVIGLNKDGSNVISKNLRDYIVNTLNGSTFKMIGTEHEVIAAKWVPIDVIIRYKKSKFGSFEQVETNIRKNLSEFFNPKNHELGGSINHSDLVALCKVDFVETVEVMLNKDPENKFNSADYISSVRQNTQDIDISIRNKLMSLVAKDKSLVKVFQPLFDVYKSDGTSSLVYSLNVKLSRNEFPSLGTIVIQREV